MSKLGIGRIILIVVCVLIVVVIALPFVIPTETYRGPIEKAVADATGREVHLKGKLAFTIYPDIGIAIGQATIGNVAGAKEPEMASIDTMVVGVRLFSLLGGRVDVSKLVLERPVIHLEVDKNGTGNWAFNTAKPAEEPKPEETSSSGSKAANFSLRGLRIEDGTLTYHDARTDKTERLDEVDVAIDSASLDEPFAIDGAATYKGQRIQVAGKVADPKAAMSQEETPASLTINSDVMKASLEGTVGGKTTATGKLHFETPSLRKLASWSTGKPISVGGGLNALSLDATISAEPGTFSASAIKLALDKMNFTGNFKLRTDTDVPTITGALSVDTLDLNTYMSATPAAAAAASAPAPASADQGWSATPIDLSVLKSANANLTLAAGLIKVRNIEVQKAQLGVNLNGGVLTTDLKSIQMYEGTGKGTLVVNASGKTPAIKNTLNVSGLKVQPFLKAFMGVDRIEGTGNVTFDVNAQGNSPKAIISALAGKGEVKFTDGMIRGVDLASVARTIQSALSGTATGDRAKTDFAEMGGTFTIANGVMTNTDFHLLNPFVRMSGNGTIDLANRTIDFHVEPKAVGSMQGQGGSASLGGIGVPFRVHGPWTKLSYGLDTQALGKTITNGLMNNLLGGKKSDSTSSSGTKSNPLDSLKGLFGK